MDASENRLFGDVRAAFQSELWKTDAEGFRDIVEEGYHLLSPDYQTYILSNLEKVPHHVRRLRYSDFNMSVIHAFMYEGKMFEDFFFAYVRHADFDHLFKTLTPEEQTLAWQGFNLLYDQWGLVVRSHRESPRIVSRRFSDHPSLTVPFTQVTLPRQINLRDMPPHPHSYDGRVIPSMMPMLYSPEITYTISEDLLRQGFHTYISTWGGYRESRTHFCLGSLRCGDKLKIRLEVSNPDQFFAELQNPESELHHYLRNYMWDFSIHMVLPVDHWAKKEAYIKSIARYNSLAQHEQIHLAPDTWGSP